TVGSVPSWIVVFAAVIIVRVKKPTRIDIAENVQKLGMIAISPEETPNPNAAPSTRRTRGRFRRAAASAPASEPIAMTEPSSPYSPAPRPNTSRAITAEEYGRSEEHTSELQSRFDLVCRLLLEKKKQSSP